MEGKQNESKHDEILERLAQLDARVEETQVSMRRMRKFMFWRLVIILVAILIPTIAIPIVLKVMVNTFFIPEYIECFKSFV